jgi:Ca2+-binding EF-hand superfamily protein
VNAGDAAAERRVFMMRILSVAVLAFLFVSPHAQAETSAPFPPLAANDLFSRLQAGATLPRYLGVISQEFRNLDANSDGDLSEADAEMHKTMMIAQQRNNHVHAIMRYDLDGDGAVTEEELRRSKAYEHRMMVAQNDNARWENEILSLLSADTDKDGKITYAEAVQYAAGNEQLRRAAQNLNAGGWAARVRNLLTLDASGKGQISLADLQAAATALFRAVDTDGNGTISQDEQQAYRSANVSPAMGGVDLSPACKLPKASEQAKVILLSAYETDALSTATIGSQDIAVHTGRIEIEAGKEPLYLVVVSHRPVIWRLSGAVERIEQLVLAGNSTGPNRGIVGQQPVVGEMGVAKERVNILPRSNCLRYFTDKPSSASAIAAAKVRQDTGKEPMVAAIYQVSEFRVPSGQAISRTAILHRKPIVSIRAAS